MTGLGLLFRTEILRYLFAYNQKALSKALGVVVRVINRHYEVRAKQLNIEGRAGGVTFIQRFGGSLNLNPHFHILYTDGVWDDEGVFHQARPPCNEDIEELNAKIKIRVFRSLRKAGLISDLNDYELGEDDKVSMEFPEMATVYGSIDSAQDN